MKELYIDMMEKVVGAYTDSHIRRYTAEVKEHGLAEHGFPRLTANLGILIAHGRKQELKKDFIEMMNLCCSEIPTARTRNGNRVGNDFSVKEIVFCILELEKAGTFNKTITDGWRDALSKINPYLTYSRIAGYPPKPLGNWAAFGAASEQLRKYARIGDESFFIENQIASQFHAFDENGMYRDPHEPIVYDLAPRIQLAVALYYGFQGEGAEILVEELLKSADKTLYMQSVTGEIPFGGRSNQFLHNEALYAALCEFYAVLFKKRNDAKKSGMFKRAARIATESILPWLDETPIPHIKNFYPTDSMYGCEKYAYYDKYMVTTASWLYLAHAISDDTICEVSCPSESENYIWETSPYFHNTALKFGDYLVQLDTSAVEEYDASGIGRIHRRGAPSAICLSVPFSKTPNYSLDIENPSPLSMCGGIKINDSFIYSYGKDTVYTLKTKEVTDEFVKYAYECENENGLKLEQTCIVSESGVELRAEGSGEVAILLALFDFDGKNHTEKSVTKKSAAVTYKGWKCIYTTDGKLVTKEKVYANRNGHYNLVAAHGKNSVTIKIEIKEIK